MPVVGFLSPGPPSQVDAIDAFRQGLREAGFVEGQNVTLEFRFAEGRFDRLPELAADLVRRKVNVIIALGGAASVAAKAATTSIPVAFYMGEDPVSLGLVPSLNRRGQPDWRRDPQFRCDGEAARTVARVRAARRGFCSVDQPEEPLCVDQHEGGPGRRPRARQRHRNRARRLRGRTEPAFATLAQAKAGALLIAPDGLFIFRAAQVAALTVRHAIPASHERRAFPVAGGLMSYGASQTDGMRLVGALGGRVLKGAKPADLPILRATKFEFVINLKTAKALGLDVPPTLLALADEVIE